MNISGARLLIVDDDAFDRLACRRALHGQGLDAIVEACTAEQALELCAAQRFDCILLDYRLPDMDGIELLRRLPQRDDDVPVPVVMLTGSEDVQIAVEAMRRGASDYLVKDSEGRYQALMPAVVHRVLRERHLRRERLRAEQALERYRVELQQLTKRLMAQEKEMTRRLAQALHDQLGQTLAAMRLTVDALQAAPRERCCETWERSQPRLSGLIDRAVQEVRQVLIDLRPPLLEEQGLMAALDNELRTHTLSQTDMALHLLTEPGCCAEVRWPAEVEYAGFMLAREAVSNALRHSGAANVTVYIDGNARALRLDVEDDGRGIPEAALAGVPGHLGLVGMRERAQAIGGQCIVQRRPEGGTRVSLVWQEPA